MSNKTKLMVRSGRIQIGDEIVPLWSGEFHFWRVQREYWPKVLESMREMGLPVVSSYIAWNFHEAAPGHFDFTGETTAERDLVGFLEMTRDMGFKVLLKPGPTINAEWAWGGPSEEADRYDRVDPRFKELSIPWIRAVGGAIAPFQATRGGHVIAIQADNEPYPDLAHRGSELGGYQQHGMFKDWITERYGSDISRLNAAWRTDHKDFSTVYLYWEETGINRRTAPENSRLLTDPVYENRILDSLAFVEWHSREIVRWVSEEYRKAGIDVPFFTNTWGSYSHNLHDAKNVADFGGIDMYPSAYFESSPWSPQGKDWDYCMEGLKVAVDNNGWGYFPELGCGFWEGSTVTEKVLTPHATAFIHRAFIANGAKGWNWYMLAARDNWCHSAINTIGEATAHFAVCKKTMDLVHKIGLHKLERAPAVSLVTNRRQRATDSGNWQNLWDALTASGVDFETVDCQYSKPKCPLILYGGSGIIESDEAENLRAAVEAGSTLVCFNEFPMRGRAGNCINPFGLPMPDGQRPIPSPFTVMWDGGAYTVPSGGHSGRIQTLYFGQVPQVSTPIYGLTGKHDAAESAKLLSGGLPRESVRLGFAMPFGKGKVVVLGMAPWQGIVGAIPKITGCSFKVSTKTAGTAVTFWGGGSEEYAFIINRNNQAVAAELWFDRAIYPDVTTVEDVESGERYPVAESGCTFVRVGGHEIVVIRIGLP